MGRQVMGRDGRSWRVRRHWAPRLGAESLWTRFRRRYKETTSRTKNVADGLDGGCAEFVADELLFLLGIVVVVVLLVFVGLPLVLAVIDLLLVAVLALGGVVARVLFRRPWTVEAVPSNGHRIEWRVSGWRDSGDLIREVERRLRDGEPLPPTSPSPSAL